MRIALIAHGEMPIPPTGWGAVENTLWNRKLQLEQRGHTVDIYNSRAIHQVVHQINRGRYDFAHAYCESHVLACHHHLEVPYAVTSEFGGLHRFAEHPGEYPAFEYLLQDTMLAPANLCVSERIRGLYERRGYRGFLRVLRNAVSTGLFQFDEEGNGRSLCLGRISRRKRQAWLAGVATEDAAVDFVGPWDRPSEPAFVPRPYGRYLGPWDKDTLYRGLTGYSCLVLLSASEAAPLVVLEAMAAGLSIVVNEAGAANLIPQPFITVLREDECRPERVREAIRQAVAENPRHRRAIRAHALERFDHSGAADDYLRLIAEFLERRPSPPSPVLSAPASADGGGGNP